MKTTDNDFIINSFQTPNVIIDKYVKAGLIDPAEACIIFIMMRHIYGFSKNWGQPLKWKIEDFEKALPTVKRRTMIRKLNKLNDYELIEVIRNPGKPNDYSLGAKFFDDPQYYLAKITENAGKVRKPKRKASSPAAPGGAGHGSEAPPPAPEVPAGPAGPGGAISPPPLAVPPAAAPPAPDRPALEGCQICTPQKSGGGVPNLPGEGCQYCTAFYHYIKHNSKYNNTKKPPEMPAPELRPFVFLSKKLLFDFKFEKDAALKLIHDASAGRVWREVCRLYHHINAGGRVANPAGWILRSALHREGFTILSPETFTAPDLDRAAQMYFKNLQGPDAPDTPAAPGGADPTAAPGDTGPASTEAAARRKRLQVLRAQFLALPPEAQAEVSGPALAEIGPGFYSDMVKRLLAAGDYESPVLSDFYGKLDLGARAQ